MGRAPCCDKANVKKGPWSPEEDARLKSYIQQHGTGGNWIALPQKIGLKRCGKSCRLRWLNYLRPNIKHGGFSEEEDNVICSLYVTIGSRWSIIAAQLPGRTDNDIKNYWNTRLKKKLLGNKKHHHHRRLNHPSAATSNPPPPEDDMMTMMMHHDQHWQLSPATTMPHHGYNNDQAAYSAVMGMNTVAVSPNSSVVSIESCSASPPPSSLLFHGGMQAAAFPVGGLDDPLLLMNDGFEGWYGNYHMGSAATTSLDNATNYYENNNMMMMNGFSKVMMSSDLPLGVGSDQMLFHQLPAMEEDSSIYLSPPQV
ncbi:unnamed protein product [Linum tenue]|uniref:Uncharacterized protein n=1 Tax=Linum tenue TaxID=586396 RepID=A0AAV0LB84_9ROSI|nr:unnamed protein product [Linum tenue]